MGKRIWLITGISGGFGKVLTEEVLSHGDFVIGSFRHRNQVDEFNAAHAGKALGVLMDITKKEEVDAVFQMLQKDFGKLDVLVNNAGFGILGAIEEVSLEECRKVLETNFFGTLYVTQQALPLMRKQQSGHIIQFSSQAGIKSAAGVGIYNASKYALEGFSEALYWEMIPFGIKVTLVEPGPFRTNFLGSSLALAERSIDAYQETVGAFRKFMTERSNGNQEGDPVKGAMAVFDITNLDNPPLRLPLGKSAVTVIQAKLDLIKQDLERFRDVAEAAVFTNNK
jgi:NAD(P)-dependent dehydrogenase (short-subunit alcohol dehydrogenase family)